MRQFLMLVGVAAVAGAMYVAAASGSQQSAGPTAKQFNALKKQVATLSKTLKLVKATAVDADGFVRSCLLSTNSGVVGASQDGSTTVGQPGYVFGTTAEVTAGTESVRTALYPTVSGVIPQAYLQAVDPNCVSSSALRQHTSHSGSSRLQLRAEHSH